MICAREALGGIGYAKSMAATAFDIDLVRTKMREARVTQSQLAQVAGITSQSAISNIFNGTRQVKVQEADAIYRFLGIDRQHGEAVVLVPVIGLAAAGNWREAIEMPIGRIPMPRRIAGAKSFAVEIAGDSIDLLAQDGDWLVIDPEDKELSPGKFYLLQNREFETTIKRYQKNPARFEPASTNPVHKAFEVSEHEFVVVGRVVWKGERL